MILEMVRKQKYQRGSNDQNKSNLYWNNASNSKTFFLADDIDEIIFYNTYEKIKSKVNRGLRINVDESIWLYCGYIIKEIRSGNNLNQIKEMISKILSFDGVMIGVTEIMKKTTFEITIEKKQSHFDIENLIDPCNDSRTTSFNSF